ncbi:MAG: hypothetical protein B6U78_01645 [Candidatus Aenigmarchaeota archaeon ex4484_224]|nr:MAG: hypothetical protein B6U78_01645 [Candidatus Aenigmarchaeota archaeon ex4484_224]
MGRKPPAKNLNKVHHLLEVVQHTERLKKYVPVLYNFEKKLERGKNLTPYEEKKISYIEDEIRHSIELHERENVPVYKEEVKKEIEKYIDEIKEMGYPLKLYGIADFKEYVRASYSMDELLLIRDALKELKNVIEKQNWTRRIIIVKSTRKKISFIYKVGNLEKEYSYSLERK